MTDARPVTGLTPAMSRCLAAIRSHQAGTGHAPSYRELQTVLGYGSVSSVHRLVQHLVRRGHVDYAPRLQRTVRAGAVVAVPSDLAAAITAAAARQCRSPDALLRDAVVTYLGGVP